MSTLIVISVMLFIAFAFASVTELRARHCKRYIDDVATKKIKPNAKFYRLLKDPDYENHYYFCLLGQKDKNITKEERFEITKN
ncbi:MAG: hypothetical protein ACOC90_05395 [Bacteroidota bacterium]